MTPPTETPDNSGTSDATTKEILTQIQQLQEKIQNLQELLKRKLNEN